jgi:hypothetical protein
LAESLRSNKFKNESAASKENFMRKSNKSRSKSPGYALGMNDDNIPERDGTLKSYQAESDG